MNQQRRLVPLLQAKRMHALSAEYQTLLELHRQHPDDDGIRHHLERIRLALEVAWMEGMVFDG
jgi:hypothetical protein